MCRRMFFFLILYIYNMDPYVYIYMDIWISHMVNEFRMHNYKYTFRVNVNN